MVGEWGVGGLVIGHARESRIQEISERMYLL